MNLLLQRMWNYPKSTMGSLFLEKLFECYTLEDVDRFLETGGVKIPKETAIARGRYKITVDWSDRFQCPMPLLLDVPQFSGIRIHILNTASETEGCIGVGRDKGVDQLYQSELAFKPLFKKIFNAWASREEVWIEIT